MFRDDLNPVSVRQNKSESLLVSSTLIIQDAGDLSPTSHSHRIRQIKSAEKLKQNRNSWILQECM